MSHLARYIEASVEAIKKEAWDGSDGRNNRLNKLAFSLGQFVDNGITEDEATTICESFADSVGLPEREAAATIKSGLRSGQARPRDFSHVFGNGMAMHKPLTAAPSMTPSATDAPPQRIAAVLKRIWDEYLSLPPRPQFSPSPSMQLFLQTRKITPEDMTSAGAFEMDSHHVAAAYDAVRHSYELTDAEKVESGWVLEKNMVPWLPLKADGLMVPIWSAAWREAPVAYRFKTWKVSQREYAKCYAMGGTASWRNLPTQHPASLGRQGGTLVIFEGEPDYLTLGRPLAELGHTVITLPGAHWSSSWHHLLNARERVVFAAHNDEAGWLVAKKVREHCKHLRIRCDIKSPKTGDWSDARQLGVALDTLVQTLMRGE